MEPVDVLDEWKTVVDKNVYNDAIDIWQMCFYVVVLIPKWNRLVLSITQDIGNGDKFIEYRDEAFAIHGTNFAIPITI